LHIYGINANHIVSNLISTPSFWIGN